MKLTLFCFALEILVAVNATLLQHFYPLVPNVPLTADDVGKRLLLTPFIESGKIQQGQESARVTGLPVDLESYAGFFTVNPKYNSNLYFWFFPAAKNPDEAPVVVWLQGGPGASSLYGLFVENGPLSVDEDMKLKLRPTSWSSICNLIFIDSPVGTGFSFTDDSKGYARNEDNVADDLYSALVQFFQLFPTYQKNEFYVTGESYAGKYVPAITNKIHEENSNAKLKINLQGMAIGNGLSDPATMIDFGTYLYNIGLLDEKETDFFLQQEAVVRRYIDEKQWIKAYEVWNNLLNNDLTNYPSSFNNFTGYEDYFNYLYPVSTTADDKYSTYVQLPEVRRAIHVGAQTYSDGSDVERHLMEDIMQSVKPRVETILDNKYCVLLYSGQLDIIVAHTFTQNFIRSLKWKGADEYSTAKKRIWKVGGEIAGYGTQAQNFAFVLVRNSGHMVPHDQPEWACDLIERFLKGNKSNCMLMI